MKLVIVESPTKANTISKFLGKDYRVESSYGHVRDLPRSRFGIDLEKNFEPTYIIPVKAKKRVTELRKLADKAKEIILASDEDREGEAIAWHLKEVLEGKNSRTKRDSVSVIDKKPLKRIVFHEITAAAINHAIENPRQIDIKMVDAQQARRILDRIVGYKLSPFLWKKIAKGLSAGRVQSVALRLIVDRENEIRAFKPEEYWQLDADLKKKTGNATHILASLTKLDGKSLNKFAVKTKAEADALTSDIKNSQFSVTAIKQTETKKNPLPPFTTSTLQQTSSSRLGYSAKKTMLLAQRLYEKGLITYMRTDSLNLSAQSLVAAKEWLTKELGAPYALKTPRTFKGKSKGAQEAHEAVRPTTLARPEDVTVEEEAERKLYKLIWQRFLATQMPQAVFNSVSVDITAQGASKKEYGFKTNGSTMKFDGFLKIYPQKFEERELPALAEGEALALEKLLPSQHFTEPPPRFSEATLIKTLEEFGIGRPSTYVPIISVIQARNYVKRETGRFHPTEIGEMVNKILVENFPQIVDINFTADMEAKLDLVAEGAEEWRQLLGNFYAPFAKNLEEKYLSVDKTNPDEKTDEVCEKCGKPMIIKFGRFGKFLACSGFPECKNAKNLNHTEVPKIDMKCPKCGDGDVVIKQSRKGRKKIFWGCSKYSKEGGCDWASWTDPTKTPEQLEAEKAAAKLAKTKKTEDTDEPEPTEINEEV